MSVEMRNLLHNPRPSGTAAWLLHNEYSNQPASMALTTDSLTLTGIDGCNNSYASCKPMDGWAARRAGRTSRPVGTLTAHRIQKCRGGFGR